MDFDVISTSIIIDLNIWQISEALKAAGYPIWIDVDQMAAYENVLEGMANAVEDAYLVLICFSEKYKESQNCRTGNTHISIKFECC